MSTRETASDRRADVVVIGAGPVGLAAAVMLGRAGIDTLVVERRTERSQHPRSRAVTCRTMEVFRGLGLSKEVRAAALPGGPRRHLGSDVVSPWRTIISSGGASADTRLGPETLDVVLCSQDALEPILESAARALPSVALETGVTARIVDDSDDGVLVSLADDGGRIESVRAQYVIAADGAGSRVRTALGIGVTGETDLQTAVSVLFRSPVIARRTGDPSSFLYIDNAETIGAVVVAPVDEVDRVAMLGRPLVMDRLPFDEIDWTEQIHLALGDPDEQVELTDARTWTVGAWVADRYRSGRVLLAGDAAHVMPPYGGFNQNTGVQDAHNLAWKLAAVIQGWADPALLESYDSERRPVAEFNTAEAVQNFRSIVGNRGTGPRSFRPENFEHPGLDIGFRYDRGAVSGEDLDRGEWPVGAFVPTAAVGERAPHVWLDAERTRSTLDLFGDRLVVLARSGSPAATLVVERAERAGIPVGSVSFGPSGDLVEAEAEWAEAYRVTGAEAVLVRPDGHVLARIAEPDPTAVEAALCALSGRAARRGPGS